MKAAFAKTIVENILFNIKWILPVFYLGLVAVLFLYGYSFLYHLYTLFLHPLYTVEELKIIVLDMVDVVMIANLIKMIITGSYHSFISKTHGKEEGTTSSGLLKIKIATSILVVSMVNLLRTFVMDPEHMVSWDVLMKQLSIFGAFLVATIVLGIIEYWHDVTESNKEKSHEVPH